MFIRSACGADLDNITVIYNQAVEKTTGTFDTEPRSMEQQRTWFADHDNKFPIWVMEVGSNVCGWIAINKWSGRCAYSDTGEISLFVEERMQSTGIGHSLLQHAVQEAPSRGLHTLLARIASGNDVSCRLHQEVGFAHIGTMKEVGRKFGQLLDVYLYQIVF